jgi:hypothetical protein
LPPLLSAARIHSVIEYQHFRNEKPRLAAGRCRSLKQSKKAMSQSLFELIRGFLQAPSFALAARRHYAEISS